MASVSTNTSVTVTASQCRFKFVKPCNETAPASYSGDSASYWCKRHLKLAHSEDGDGSSHSAVVSLENHLKQFHEFDSKDFEPYDALDRFKVISMGEPVMCWYGRVKKHRAIAQQGFRSIRSSHGHIFLSKIAIVDGHVEFRVKRLTPGTVTQQQKFFDRGSWCGVWNKVIRAYGASPKAKEDGPAKAGMSLGSKRCPNAYTVVLLAMKLEAEFRQRNNVGPEVWTAVAAPKKREQETARREREAIAQLFTARQDSHHERRPRARSVTSDATAAFEEVDEPASKRLKAPGLMMMTMSAVLLGEGDKENPIVLD
eukprot:TRINITY_DN6274_c0_g1_i2.p1 TRINITY_DN6274_c0_g1~~TRINITY_DN6274_c0_g1_i2.p1  ORF type:complete len:313 (-),score=46.63 TRINITY_DN6274_c0_g1_i2:96-1034(-)